MISKNKCPIVSSAKKIVIVKYYIMEPEVSQEVQHRLYIRNNNTIYHIYKADPSALPLFKPLNLVILNYKTHQNLFFSIFHSNFTNAIDPQILPKTHRPTVANSKIKIQSLQTRIAKTELKNTKKSGDSTYPY